MAPPAIGGDQSRFVLMDSRANSASMAACVSSSVESGWIGIVNAVRILSALWSSITLEVILKFKVDERTYY